MIAKQQGRWHSSRRVAAALAAVLIGPGVALAGPPFLTDDPEPTDTGHWEIYAPAADISGQGAAFDGSVGAEINYGPAPNVQLTLGLPAAFSHDSSGSSFGRGDLEVSVKYRFFHNEAAGVQVAVFPGITLPTASRGLGSPHVTALLPVWAQKDAGPWSVSVAAAMRSTPGGTIATTGPAASRWRAPSAKTC